MKRIWIIVMLLVLLMLNGCGTGANIPFSESKAPPDTAAASEEKDPGIGTDISSQVVIRENAEESDSKEPEVKPDDPEETPDSKQPDEGAESIAPTSSQTVNESADEQMHEELVSEESGTYPVEQEPVPASEQEAESEQSVDILPEAPGDESDPEPKPETESDPEPTTEPDAAFDIDYWIGYAINTAAGLGLELDPSAVDCWDNPITANPDCIYLERDINARLSRYAGDEDITVVWIWYENVGTNRYLIYIGYA